jgi:predicted dithiol-disulfide oxidoreductase (DUF899 family)
MSQSTIEPPKVVSQAEWVAARKELLRKEKEFTRLRDQLSRERRELPWEKVEKKYVFDGPGGKESLGDLFGGKSQLIIYHFMFGPEWKEGCPSCSFNMDHTDGALVHLGQRDVTFAAISRAPLPKIQEPKTQTRGDEDGTQTREEQDGSSKNRVTGGVACGPQGTLEKGEGILEVAG